MKKTKIVLFLLGMLFVFAGCGNKNAPQKQSSKSSSPTTVSSVVLYDGTPLYRENSDGKMVYADEVQLGEEIQIFLKGSEIEEKTAIRLLSSGKEESFNFVHVSYYDKDYWTRDIFITNNAALTAAAIIEDSVIYTSPDATGASTKKLEKGAIVATDSSSKRTDSDLGIEFIPVTYYNATPFGKEAFVKSANISTKQADIVALQTLSKIAAYKELKPEVTESILRSLDELSVSEFVSEKIQSAKNNY